MTANLIASIVGFIISIGLEVVPKIKDKWSDWEYKPLTLLLLFVGTPLVAWLLQCLAELDFGIAMDCTAEGLLTVLGVGFIGFATNQATYTIATRKFPNAIARQ